MRTKTIMIFTKPSILIQGILLLFSISLQAQITPEIFWKPTSTLTNNSTDLQDSERHYQLHYSELVKKVHNAPYKDATIFSKNNLNTLVSFPDLQGNFKTYRILKLRTMSSELYQKYPMIHSFIGFGVENPQHIIRFTMDSQGINGKVIDTNGIYYIQQLPKTTANHYSVTTEPNEPKEFKEFKCQLKATPTKTASKSTFSEQKQARPKQLLIFRLAVAATGEYSQYFIRKANLGANASDQEKKAVVLAAINKTVTNINEIFERELSVTFRLIPNNDKILFLDPDADPFTNESIRSIVEDESQNVFDSAIGFDNYDLGHVLGTNDGINGYASLNVICKNTKAKGATQYFRPEGIFFDVNIVAHEFGHQFGARHTFNNDCLDDARHPSSAVEPGSGTTIMSYAGICSPDIQDEVDPYFHAISLQQIFDVTNSVSSDCGIEIQTIDNVPPTLPDLQNYTIPHSTPFVLNVTATDQDQDTLTYCWEQQDNGIAIMPPEPEAIVGPLFRSVLPTKSSQRFFPSYEDVLNGRMSTTWEVLPTTSRELNFSLTARDNNPLGGMATIKKTKIKVAESGPFQITSQNTAGIVYDQKSIQRITWDVAKTNGADINAKHVKILLSYDNGKTFDTVLYGSSDNDGEELVRIPEKTGSTQCRIKIVPTNNIFYTINSKPFEISNIVEVPKIKNGTIKIFPNPNDGRFVISFGRFTTEKSPISVQIFNISGKLMFHKIFNNSFNTILSFKEYATGVYLVRVVRNNEVINKKLIIK